MCTLAMWHHSRFFCPTNSADTGVTDRVRPFWVDLDNAGADGTWAVLNPTPHGTSSDWRVVPITGQTLTDTGPTVCLTQRSP
jgi:hypothetical protein